jgi:hypothetical protein
MLPIIPLDYNNPLTDPLLFRNNHLPTKTKNNKYVYITNYKYLNDPIKRQEILYKFDRLDEQQLIYSENNCYTWIIYSEKNNPNLKFRATQIISPYEVGTRHQSIIYDDRLNVDKIYFAGELKKDNKNIIYNLSSGSYSLPIKNNNVEYLEYVNNAKKIFNTLFVSPIYTDNLYLNDNEEIKIISDNLLEIYESLGLEVYKFDSITEFNNFIHTKK